MNVFLLNLQNDNSFLEIIKHRLAAAYPDLTFIEIKDVDSMTGQLFSYWDTILLVFFKETNDKLSLLQPVLDYFRQQVGAKGRIVPISCDKYPFPPAPIDTIKSLSILETSDQENLVKRIGAYLGIRWIPKDSDIFISYKVSDGKPLARQVKKILEDMSFNVWFDENRDDDNEGNIKVGQDCQNVIIENVNKARLVVLIDTPDAPKSKWVNAEIDYANAALVPILPIVFKSGMNQGSHFRSLLDLKRWVQFTCADTQTYNISKADENAILDYLIRYLLEFHNRKKNLPGKIESLFLSSRYTKRNDETLEKQLCFVFDKQEKKNWKKVIFTHAFGYPSFFKNGIRVFGDYITSLTVSPHHYFIIYEGEEWTDDVVADLRVTIPKENLRSIHIGELALEIEHA